MKRIEVIQKAILQFTTTRFTNRFILTKELTYLTNEYLKLNKKYSYNKLDEEYDEVKECIDSVYNLINTLITKDHTKTVNNFKENIEKYNARLLGLFLEISDLILVISYLDSIYKTDYVDKYIPKILNEIQNLDNHIPVDRYKILNLLKQGNISILTKILEYKVSELYTAKKLGNGEYLNDESEKYELIFHTLYPNKDLIEETNYKMIRKWIFVDKFDYLLSLFKEY